MSRRTLPARAGRRKMATAPTPGLDTPVPDPEPRSVAEPLPPSPASHDAVDAGDAADAVTGASVPGAAPEHGAGPDAGDATAAPDDIAPDDIAPDDAAPDDTAPDDAAPDDSAPDDTAPDDSAPDDSAPDDAGPGEPGGESVVLALGQAYFADGRVGPERYASDLTPSFVGAVTAGHTLLRGLFEDLGVPHGTPIEASADRWRIRLGSELGQALFVEVQPSEGPPTSEGPAPGERDNADAWVRGLVASRDADHGQALAAFEAEAETAAAEGAPQRAAIAYRSAAAAAMAAGRGDHANRLMRLAGKAYLEIAEKPETIPQGVFMAYREGARCFLEAGNLPLAHTCLTKAIAIGDTLGYTAKR
ncbi:MAG TPA: hypothetical protein VMB72_09445 [Acidimicrobiales bacterium]|nr:hypothetical protein [Acidimicrobiales bacterium]